MSDDMQICQICLRTDRNLREIDKNLMDFLDELCDYSIDVGCSLFCSECEYLLKKLYNFRNKCVKAIRILKRWRKSNATDKTPLNMVHTLLPPSSLGLWLTTNSRMYILSREPNASDDGPCINMITAKPEYLEIEEHVPMKPTRSKRKTKAVNVRESQNKCIKKSAEKPTNQLIGNNKIKVEEDNDINIMNLLHSNTNEDLILKTEDSSVTFEVITVDNLKNEDVTQLINEAEDAQINQNEADDQIDSKSMKSDSINRDDSSINSYDIDTIDAVLDSDNDVKDTKKRVRRHNNVNVKVKLKSDSLNEQDDSSINSNDVDTIDRVLDSDSNVTDTKKVKNDDTVNVKLKKRRKRREAANPDLKGSNCGSNSDFKMSDEEVKLESSDEDLSEIKRANQDSLVVKFKKMNSDLDGLYENCEKLLPSKKRKLLRKPAKNNQRAKRKLVRDVVTRLKHVDRKFDDICENTENVLLQVKSGHPFNREKLKAELEAIFDSCGDLYDDGKLIDKQFIMSCLDDKVSMDLWRLLWNNVHRKKVLKPKAIHVLYWIQKKYKKNTGYDAVFDIEYLNTQEKILEEFHRRKNYEYYIKANYKCEICYMGFQYKKLLTNHLELHDDTIGELTCPICKLRTKSRKSFNNHRRSHEIVYKCKLCPLVTHYQTSMKNHYNQHKGVEYSCETCNTTYKSSSAYATHLTYIHGRKYTCTSCGDAFATETKLLAHTNKLHQDAEPTQSSVSCDQCDLTFPTLDACRKHIRVSHKPAIKPRRPRQHNVTKKSGIQPKKMPLMTCRVCNATGGYGWLTLHFKTDHPTVDMKLLYSDKQSNLCHICGKGFTTIYNLRTHLNKHNGIRPYACQTCPKRFRSSMGLATHRLLHLPRSLPCSVCGKMFRSRANLYSHMQFHIGDRRYKCSICSKGFLHSSTLNEHVRGVHLNERRVRGEGRRRGTIDTSE